MADFSLSVGSGVFEFKDCGMLSGMRAY